MTCHLCNSPLDEAPIVGTKARGDRPSRRVACLNCGLVQTVPQPTQAELDAYYSSGEFWRDHQTTGLVVSDRHGNERFVGPGSPEYAATIEMMHRQRAERVVEDLGLRPGDRVLEIGCASGLTLAALQKFGMGVYGLEPDAGKAADATERLGVHITNTSLESYAESCRQEQHRPVFDAVIAFHVLEHFTDPLGSLALIRTLLKPGGRVYVEVPDVAQPGIPLVEHWMHTHMFDFERHTLASLLKRAGFDDVASSAHGNLPSRPARLLHAWGTHGTSAPREYEEHGGPRGEQIAAFLRDVESRGTGTLKAAPQAPDLQRLRASQPPYNSAQYDALRAELAAYDTSVSRLATAYHDATDMLGEMSVTLDNEAQVRLESYHSEEWAHYYALGEGMAFVKAKTMVAGAANAMRLVELMDGGEQ